MPSHVIAAIQERCLLSHNSPEHCLSGNVQVEAVSELVLSFKHAFTAFQKMVCN